MDPYGTAPARASVLCLWSTNVRSRAQEIPSGRPFPRGLLLDVARILQLIVYPVAHGHGLAWPAIISSYQPPLTQVASSSTTNATRTRPAHTSTHPSHLCRCLSRSGTHIVSTPVPTDCLYRPCQQARSAETPPSTAAGALTWWSHERWLPRELLSANTGTITAPSHSDPARRRRQSSEPNSSSYERNLLLYPRR